MKNAKVPNFTLLGFCMLISIITLQTDIHMYSEFQQFHFDFLKNYSFIQSEIKNYVKNPNVLTLNEIHKQMKQQRDKSFCKLCNKLKKGKNSNSTPRDLIIGVAVGERQKNLLSFVRTLRTVESKSTFAMIVDDDMMNHGISEQEKDLLLNCSTIFLNVGEVYKYRESAIVLSRNVMFLALLQNIWHEFDRVIIADMYDTIFQADPFTTEFSYTGVVATLENKSITRDKINSDWILRTDPEFTDEKYRNHLIINGGLWYGGVLSMIEFLGAYIDYHIWFEYSRLLNDQSILNMMYVDGKLPKSFTTDKKGYMVSAYMWRFDWRPNEDGMFNAEGIYPVTIHQYNRVAPIRNYLPSLCPPLGDWDTNSYAYHHFIPKEN